MAIFTREMDISVTDFKNNCLEVIRRVESTGHSIAITRRGKVVARLGPSSATTTRRGVKPWELLRETGGELIAAPAESVVCDEDFGALR